MKCKICETNVHKDSVLLPFCYRCWILRQRISNSKEDHGAALKILKGNTTIETASDHQVEIKIDDCLYIVCGDYFKDTFGEGGRLYHECFEVHEVYNDFGEKQPEFIAEYFEDQLMKKIIENVEEK